MIQASTTVVFTGLLVVPENLSLNSPTKEELIEVAGEFIELGDFCAPEADGQGFRFRPRD
jgi:hypothetical protein